MTPIDTPADQLPENKRQFWKTHIEHWQKSGLSQLAYCRDNRLKAHQMTYWKKRLVEPDACVSFVPLQLTGNLPVPVNRCSFNLFTPNGYRIQVDTGFDPHTLKQLIGVVNCL